MTALIPLSPASIPAPQLLEGASQQPFRPGPALEREAHAPLHPRRGAAAVRDGARVALPNVDPVHRQLERRGQYLREHCLVALALGLDADPDDRGAGGMDPDLGGIEHLDADDVEVVGRPGAHDLRERRDADAHQLAAGALNTYGCGPQEASEILNKTFFQLKIAGKKQVEGPTFLFPAAGGPAGSLSTTGNAATVGTSPAAK